jgi:hypothetical protein
MGCQLEGWPPSSPIGYMGQHLRRFVLGVGIKPVGADRERLASTPFGHHPPCLRSPESKLCCHSSIPVSRV